MSEEPIKMNDVTFEDTEKMDIIWQKIWFIHNSPVMGDCVTIDYSYEIKDNRVLCFGDPDTTSRVDITEDIECYDYWKLRSEYFQTKYENLKIEMEE